MGILPFKPMCVSDAYDASEHVVAVGGDFYSAPSSLNNTLLGQPHHLLGGEAEHRFGAQTARTMHWGFAFSDGSSECTQQVLHLLSRHSWKLTGGWQVGC